MDYTTIENPYNNLLERGGTQNYNVAPSSTVESNEIPVQDLRPRAINSPADIAPNVFGGQSFENIWINSWIKSNNYKPKSAGFLIDGRLGYIECMKLYVGSGGIIGGSLDIPDDTTANSFHVESDGDTWWGCNVANWNADQNNAIAYVLKTGEVKFVLGTIAGWTIIDGYIYNLQSGTPTSSPNDGIVMASGNEGIIVYEDTAKRAEFGYLSSGVYGLKIYDTGGSDVIFETSDTQQKIAGWYFTNLVLRNNTTDANSNVLIDSSNSLIRLGPTTGNYLNIDGANQKIESSNYVSGFMGSGFTLSSNLLEVGNIASRGIIRTSVFEYNQISANSGSILIVKSADKLNADMTALDASTLTIEGNVTFSVGDILRIKEGLNDEYLSVTNIASAPTYTVTRDLAGSYTANNNPAWSQGGTVVNYGQSGDGGLYLTADDTNAPYLSVFTHAGAPYTTTTTQLRLGNLNGYLGYVADTYGLGIGSSSASKANMTFDITNGIRIRTATAVKFQVDNSGNAFFAGSLTLGDGSTTSGRITMSIADTLGDCFINAGKTDFGDTTNGLIFGIDDSDSNKVKLEMGGATDFINMEDGSITISGTLTVGSIPDLPSDTYLAGYWSFDEGSGNVAVDNSGNGNNAALSNVSFVQGISGTAGSYNGTTSYSLITDSSDIQNTFDGGGSLCFWINPTSAGENNVGRIYRKGDIIDVYVSDLSGGVLKLTFFQDFSGNDYYATTTDRVILVGEANLVVIKYNSSSVANQATIYVWNASNGWSTPALTHTTPTGTRTTDAGSNLCIGNNLLGTRTFDGWIDEVRLYSTTLTLKNAEALSLSPSGGKGLGVISANKGIIGDWVIGSGQLASSNGKLKLLSNSEQILVGDATDYLTGAGIFAGLSSGAYKVSMGDPAGEYMAWPGSGGWITNIPDINQQLPSMEDAVFFYSFDENTGSNVKDLTINAEDATATGTTIVVGKTFRARYCNGTSSDYISTNYTGVINSLYIRLKREVAGTLSRLCGQEYATLERAGDWGAYITTGNKITLSYYDSSHVNQTITTTNTVPIDAFFDVYIASGTNGHQIWVNQGSGWVLEASDADTTSLGNSVNVEEFEIGRYGFNSSYLYGGVKTFDIIIGWDNDKLLTESELAALYKNPGGMKSALGLAAEPGADVTGDHAADIDVLATQNAPAEAGANITETRTSNNTSSVAATLAANIEAQRFFMAQFPTIPLIDSSVNAVHSHCQITSKNESNPTYIYAILNVYNGVNDYTSYIYRFSRTEGGSYLYDGTSVQLWANQTYVVYGICVLGNYVYVSLDDGTNFMKRYDLDLTNATVMTFSGTRYNGYLATDGTFIYIAEYDTLGSTPNNDDIAKYSISGTTITYDSTIDFGTEAALVKYGLWGDASNIWWLDSNGNLQKYTLVGVSAGSAYNYVCSGDAGIERACGIIKMGSKLANCYVMLASQNGSSNDISPKLICTPMTLPA